MRAKFVAGLGLSILWFWYSCNPNGDAGIDYGRVKRELLKDPSLTKQAERIDDIIQFYKLELPHHFSYRVMLSFSEGEDIYLDTMDDAELDSLREHKDGAMQFRIIERADSVIVDEEYLISHIWHALASAGRYLWNQKLPDSIFLNYLLPYKVRHEYPGTWWEFLAPTYRDSLALWSSASYRGFDAGDARWIQRYTTIYPRELPMWWNYNPEAQTFTKYPSLKEIRLLKDGGCYLEAILNVMILRTCGIPATIYEVPYWGSRNGSHAGDVFWSSRARKMRTRYSWVTYDPVYYVRPSKVMHYTYRYIGAYREQIAPHLNGETLQIPQMRGDHWYDATSMHTRVSDLSFPVRKAVAEKMDLGYIYVMNYGEWVPVDYGLIQADSIDFGQMGRDVIYRIGFYSGGKHYYTSRPFLLDLRGDIRYSEPDMMHTITIQAGKINHGNESNVVAGRTYTLRYMNREGKWQNHATKRCEVNGELTFRHVPSDAFYQLSSPSDHRKLARIFLVGKDGDQWWY